MFGHCGSAGSVRGANINRKLTIFLAPPAKIRIASRKVWEIIPPTKTIGVIRSIHTIEQGSFRGTVILQNTMHGGTSVSSTSWYYRKAALIGMMDKVPNNILFLKKNLEIISALRNRPLPRARVPFLLRSPSFAPSTHSAETATS